MDRYIFFSILRKKQSSSPIDEICVRLFFSDLTTGEQITEIWHQKTSPGNPEEPKPVIGQGFLEN